MPKTLFPGLFKWECSLIPTLFKQRRFRPQMAARQIAAIERFTVLRASLLAVAGILLMKSALTLLHG
jgi:hypothetical protein